MDSAAIAKKLGGMNLGNNVKIVSDGYDGYQVHGSQVIIPRHSYVESNTALNSQESCVTMENGATLDMSKATPEMTKAAYEISVKQYPNAAKNTQDEEMRKEYAWMVLQKLIENPDLLNEDTEPEPKPKEEKMLPRSKPDARMKQPPRAAEKKKFTLNLKKKKPLVKAAVLPSLKSMKRTTVPARPPEPAPEPPKPVSLSKLLQIPDLDYKAKKPTMEVMFDFGALGRQRARYHWVGVSEKTLNLVFDTRFKMMDPYIPAQIDDSDHVTEVSISTAGSDKHYDYRCWGTVISMELGIFKIVQLVLVKDELGARLHEENDDGQDGDDRSGADSGGGRGWADPGAQAAQEEGIRVSAREPRD